MLGILKNVQDVLHSWYSVDALIRSEALFRSYISSFVCYHHISTTDVRYSRRTLLFVVLFRLDK